MDSTSLAIFCDTEIVDITIGMTSVPPSVVVRSSNSDGSLITATFPYVYALECKIIGVLAYRELIDAIAEDSTGGRKAALQSAAPLTAKEYRVVLMGGSELALVSEEVCISSTT